MGHPYEGARFALLTRHGKAQAISPPLRETFGATLELIDGFDTDTLGTFTREVPRAGTQLEAARRKALLACELSGLFLRLGSEGAFAPGPYGLGAWNHELLVLVDRERGLEVVGRAFEPGLHHHETVHTLNELHSFARTAGFPEHALVLRPNGPDDPRTTKGIDSWLALGAAFDVTQREAVRGSVFVENDLRAHKHPSRMALIGRAAGDLMDRLRRRCPGCDAPGFGVVAVVTGLPCGDCGEPTRVPRADELGCVRCPRRELRPRDAQPLAEPSQCPFCNP
jgi:hypothetical protein